jgi:hypothetical protein
MREIITANKFIILEDELFYKKNESKQIIFKRKMARDGNEHGFDLLPAEDEVDIITHCPRPFVRKPVTYFSSPNMFGGGEICREIVINYNCNIAHLF